MIDGKLIEGEFLIAHQAMEIIELAEVKPFRSGVRATRFGLACTANSVELLLVLLPFYGLPNSLPGIFCRFGLCQPAQLAIAQWG